MKLLSFILFSLSSITLGAQGTNSLTLQQLVDSALQNNIALKNAKLDVEAAHRQRQEAFTNFFPTISATGAWFNADKGMAKMDIDPSEYITPELGAALAQTLPAAAMASLASPMSAVMMKNGAIAGITAMQPVFAGGQIVNGNKLARVGEEASRLQMHLSEKEIIRTTEEYYWQLVTLQEKKRTLEAADSLLSAIAKDVEAAVRAGVALRNDLLQVQLRKNDLESQRLKLQNGIAIMHLLTSQHCGLKGAWEVSLEEPRPTNTEGLTASSASLPEYQLLQKQVEAARLQHKMAIGKRLPTIAVGAGYNYHNLLDNDRSFGMVFATVNVPISDWWGGSHEIQRKKIEKQKAEQQLADNAEKLDIRRQKAWNDLQEATQQLDIANRSMEQTEENLRLHRNFYRAGTCTMSDLLQAQLMHQQAQDKRTEAIADCHLKQLAYRQACE